MHIKNIGINNKLCTREITGKKYKIPQIYAEAQIIPIRALKSTLAILIVLTKRAGKPTTNDQYAKLEPIKLTNAN